MGLLQSVFKRQGFNPATGWTADGAAVSAYASPWNTGAGLAPVIVADGILQPAQGVRVADCLAIPPVARAIMLYASVIAAQPLEYKWVGDGDAPAGLVDLLAWLDATGTHAYSPELRNVQLAQDIFFAGHACLEVTRDADGYVQDAIRLPLDRWGLAADGSVEVDGLPIDQSRVVYIPGFLPMGFLTYAEATIKHYKQMVRTIEARSANPVPMVGIIIEDGCTLTAAEIAQVRDDWAAARRHPNGGAAVIPKGIKIEVYGVGADDGLMLTNARNAARLDVANYVNAPAALLEGNSGTSGTYENTLQNQNEFAHLSLPLFLMPIALRLSQDDVTPPGVQVRFDSTDFDALPDAKGNIGTAVAPAAPAAIERTPTA